MTNINLLVKDLLNLAKIKAEIIAINTIGSGGNNRLFKVDTTLGTYVAKQYFSAPDERWSRIRSEISFLTYAHKIVPEFVPKYHSDINGWALYEYIAGRHLYKSEIANHHIIQAINFFRSLNNGIHNEDSSALPIAADACFTIQDHLNNVSLRVDEIQNAVLLDHSNNLEATLFINDLKVYWKFLAHEVCELAESYGCLSKPIEKDQECISPSDFGFHNALIEPSGKIRFIDFEYAGIDDPAKMIGDFFSQLAIPIPEQYYDFFVRSTLKGFPNSDYLIFRANLLKNVFRIKWCCIAMNIFIPSNMARRIFSKPHLDQEELKVEQLNKAKLIFQNLTNKVL